MPHPFLAVALVSSALGVPEYGHDFVRIGDAGNAPTDPAVHHPTTPRPLGGVGYEYRLTRTELTNSQQIEFLRAYAPYYTQHDNSLRSWGDITFVGLIDGVAQWSLDQNESNHPGSMSPRLWMRYCNWLHNDKALTEDAFQSGAYDTSTFGRDENDDLTDQMTRSPGARFWIPSLDEWVKGGYYDPDRYGEGEGGYWIYPNGSDTPSVFGLPEEGGETNAGPGDLPEDVGSYPDEQTPWGLLDYSGGGHELTERVGLFYLALGSDSQGLGMSMEDIGSFGFTFENARISLRLASAVPAPSGVLPLGVIGLLARNRRRR